MRVLKLSVLLFLGIQVSGYAIGVRAAVDASATTIKANYGTNAGNQVVCGLGGKKNVLIQNTTSSTILVATRVAGDCSNAVGTTDEIEVLTNTAYEELNTQVSACVCIRSLSGDIVSGSVKVRVYGEP